MIHYNNRVFKSVANTENGETSDQTTFLYKQHGNILTSDYSGGKIINGHLMGLVDEAGVIKMSYHQINDKQELRTGICTSTPEILPNGKIKLYEVWQWTSGDKSTGQSVLEEQ